MRCRPIPWSTVRGRSRRRPRPRSSAAAVENSTAFEPAYYTVQVGSFASERNAGALLAKLLKIHYDAYLERDEAFRHVRVRVGKLPSRGEAMMLAERLRKDGYPTKICP